MMSNARKKWLIPRVVWDGARRAWSWVWKAMTDGFSDAPASQQDKARTENLFGWFDPAMDQHFADYEANPIFHERKNLGREWVRLDAQRGYKVLSMFVVWAGLLGLVLGSGLGVLGYWLVQRYLG
jgi:hypothetical protein